MKRRLTLALALTSMLPALAASSHVDRMALLDHVIHSAQWIDSKNRELEGATLGDISFTEKGNQVIVHFGYSEEQLNLRLEAQPTPVFVSAVVTVNADGSFSQPEVNVVHAMADVAPQFPGMGR